MEPDNYDNLLALIAKSKGTTKFIRAAGVTHCALQLAGIHDALIRLEATIRMIGVQLQERAK